jgi:hypothetical protein
MFFDILGSANDMRELIVEALEQTRLSLGGSHERLRIAACVLP